MEAEIFLQAQELLDANRRLRQANEELGRLKEDLERRFAERTAELTRTNEALRESEDRFRALMEQAPFSVQAFSPDGRTVRVNRAWEELWGTTLDQMDAYNILQDPQLEKKGIAPFIRRAFAGEPVHIPPIPYDPNETIPGLTRHQDPLRWVAAVAYPLKDRAGRVREVVLVHRDITARTRAEEEVRFQAQLLDAVGQAAIATDLDGTIIYWNHFAETLYGWARQEALGRNVMDIVVAPSVAEQATEIMERLRAGQSWSGEFQVQRRDGTVFPALVTDTPIFDNQGRIKAVIGISSDISEQKRLEKELRQHVGELSEAEERIRSVVNNVIDGILTIDQRGIVQSMNPAAERLFGYSAAEVVGRNIKLLMPEPYHSEHDAYIANYLRTGQAKIIGIGQEVYGRRKDGSTFPMYLAVGEFRLGSEHFFTGVVRDITESRRVEQSLRFLADASATLAVLVDYQSTLQKVAALAVPQFADWCAVDMIENDGSLRRLAVAHVDPAKVKLAHELERRYPPDPASPYGVPRVIRTGLPDMMEEIPIALMVQQARDEDHLRLLRELAPKSYMCVPLQGRTKLLGVVTFASAESGRRYTQADLAFAQELARRAAIAIENAQLYAEMRRADRMKDEFLAMLAHELRNPLAPVRNALYIMKQPGANGATLQQVRDMAERQVQHMARLLDDLLDVSRISRGKIQLRREVLDVTAVVNRAVEAVRPLLEQRQHELTVSLPPSSLWVDADPTRLEQVLTNLLNNAAKYTDPGGKVSLIAQRNADEIVLRVRDTGIGIAPEMLPRIFDLFVQADRKLDRSQGGVGIGLTLVKKLVELHGGHIEAHSPGLGQGSEFVVRLPAALDREKPATGDAGEVSPALPRCRVLVVDDNPDAADSLAMLLRLAGHDVQTAYEGPAALLQAQEFLPELVLLDIGMPGMDGYEVARRLRSEARLQGARLVALTGWGQEQDRRRSAEAGFNQHIVKPIEPKALEALLAGLQREKG